MSTKEQHRIKNAKRRAERIAAGEHIKPQRHTRETLIETLARRSIRDANGCLLWTGYVDKRTGYGVIGIARQLTKVHRAAWELANGPIPKGMSVCHHCDVRNCIEPTHLWLGTYADNNRDMFAKGRHRSMGGWNKGIPHSTVTKAKIAAKATGRLHQPHTAEAREKMSQARAAWWKRRKEKEAQWLKQP